jgi:hypothetical protein
LIERSPRAAAEDEAMVLAALASLWHWTQRADCTQQNLSIGHWLASRAYALVGQGESAMRHANRSLEYATGLPPFFVGYAHEAIARAALTLDDLPKLHEHLAKARQCASAVSEVDDRKLLEDDLHLLG